VRTSAAEKKRYLKSCIVVHFGIREWTWNMYTIIDLRGSDVVRRRPGTDLVEVLAILLGEGFVTGLPCLMKIIPNAVIVALLARLRRVHHRHCLRANVMMMHLGFFYGTYSIVYTSLHHLIITSLIPASAPPTAPIISSSTTSHLHIFDCSRSVPLPPAGRIISHSANSSHAAAATS
jgi:hypothetical protein